MTFIEILRKISNIQPSSLSATYQSYKQIFENEFLNQLGIINENNERIHSSIGQFRIANIWWTGIFNYDFYKRKYNIENRSQMSASKGYYVVYLWNEDRTYLYLAIMPASKGLSLSKNQDHREQTLSLNEKLLSLIKMKPNYITSLRDKLNTNGNSELATDYEIGTIVAIEYDLSKNICDEQFKNDLINILNDFDIIASYLINKDEILPLSNTVEETLESNEDLIRSLYGSKNRKISKTRDLNAFDIDLANHRKISYSQSTMDKRGKDVPTRYPALSDVFKRMKEYQCYFKSFSMDWSHTTFLSNKGTPFVEVHHLIPMEFQYLFSDFQLDCTDNMICLCVTCHKAIHHGTKEVKRMLLKPLYEESPMKKILIEYGYANNFEEFLTKFY